MFDARVRAGLAPYLDAAARRLAAAGVPADALTGAGFAAGAAACVAAATARWPLALTLWLANRVLDGLDGAVARVRGASHRGGFLDIVADFAVYGGFVLGVAVARPEARLACVALLAAYYVSGSALLAWSSLAERQALATGDERSLRFVGGLAEGTETVVVYVLLCLFPGAAAAIAWGFAAAVAVTAAQRAWFAARALGRA
jgi:phosphatidylglycerophosphate synthase